MTAGNIRTYNQYLHVSLVHALRLRSDQDPIVLRYVFINKT